MRTDKLVSYWGRRIAIYVALLILSSCSTQQSFVQKDPIWNTVLYSPSFFIDSYEVSVGDWITYITITTFPDPDPAATFFLGDHLEQIRPMLPEAQTEGWYSYVMNAFLRQDTRMETQTVYNECTNKYTRIALPETAWDSIETYRMMDVPVTGITYEQALKYLEYRQQFANSCEKNQALKHYRFECFLPTPEQFDSLQTKADSSNAMRCDIFNYRHELCQDCPQWKIVKDHPVLKNVGKHPIGVARFFPDEIGLYDIKGNVAEMTSVKGIAKGGSCHHYASEVVPGKIQTYTKPEFWLGFRVWYRVYPR